ncbi:MAG: acyl-CoA thioesterase [Clostridium sp.]|nr:acyl-CoA thioesterase [Clostridium sp.]
MDTSKYTFSMQMQVRDYEVDAEGIVNNAEYLHYMEHTRHEFCRKAGITFRQMRERGIDPVATRIEISYKQPLRLSDEMVSCLNISRHGAQFIFEQDIYRADGELAAAGVVKIACIENGRLSRGEALAEAFQPFLK